MAVRRAPHISSTRASLACQPVHTHLGCARLHNAAGSSLFLDTPPPPPPTTPRGGRLPAQQRARRSDFPPPLTPPRCAWLCFARCCAPAAGCGSCSAAVAARRVRGAGSLPLCGAIRVCVCAVALRGGGVAWLGRQSSAAAPADGTCRPDTPTPRHTPKRGRWLSPPQRSPTVSHLVSAQRPACRRPRACACVASGPLRCRLPWPPRRGASRPLRRRSRPARRSASPHPPRLQRAR